MSSDEATSADNLIDVVIVNYNSGEILQECLHYLLDETADCLKVIVVDNGSDDGSLKKINSDFKQVKVIKNKHNQGFAKACNQGADWGQAKTIAFVNPDCFIKVQQLTQLAETLQSDRNNCLVGCRVLNNDGTLQAASRRRLPTFWRVVFHLSRLSKIKFVKGINIKDSGRFSTPIQVEAVNGACFVVNREDYNVVGGFDENYPLHFEDLDLFVRLAKLNKTLLYDSSVEVNHLQGHAKQDSNKVKAWKRQGLLRFFRNHRPVWEAKVIGWFLRDNKVNTGG